MDNEAVHASPSKTGIIILGGGLPKHHICNANMMRNGADFAVFVNTAQEFDGSDSGARPDEAISWGKIKSTAKNVKVCIVLLNRNNMLHIDNILKYSMTLAVYLHYWNFVYDIFKIVVLVY